MATPADLADWLVTALRSYGGIATPVELARHVWTNHQAELKDSGDLYFTWQLDLYAAAALLRERKVMRSERDSSEGMWELA